MSDHNTIEAYNQYLINNQIIPTIIDYVKEINKIKYHIDINFINGFIESVNQDECYIRHNMLQDDDSQLLYVTEQVRHRVYNTEYAKYYLILEESIKYFNDYQLELNKKYIIKLKNKIEKKDCKIDKLEEKVNKLLENNEKILKDNENTKIMNDKLLDSLNNANCKLDKTNNELYTLKNQNNELLDSVEDLKDKLEVIYRVVYYS
jgi:chromosome segregation ATPase